MLVRNILGQHGATLPRVSFWGTCGAESRLHRSSAAGILSRAAPIQVSAIP